MGIFDEAYENVTNDKDYVDYTGCVGIPFQIKTMELIINKQGKEKLIVTATNIKTNDNMRMNIGAWCCIKQFKDVIESGKTLEGLTCTFEKFKDKKGQDNYRFKDL